MNKNQLKQEFLSVLNSKDINDASMYPNANKGGSYRSVETLVQELFAKQQEDLGMAMLEDFLPKESKEFLLQLLQEGDLYLHDRTKILVPYCISLDLSRLLYENTNYGRLITKPVKRIDSYVAAVGDSVSQFCFYVAGAIGLGTFFIDMGRLMKDTHKWSLYDLQNSPSIRKFVENKYQQLIHSLNFYARGTESAFTNLSVFDEKTLRHIEGIDEDLIPFIIEAQLIFLEFFNQGDPSMDGLPYTFPIVTINVSDTNSEFMQKVSKFDFFRFNYFLNKDEAKFAMCCFSKDEQVLIKQENVIKLYKFNEVPEADNLETLYKGNWIPVDKIKVSAKGKELFNIATTNGKNIKATGDHLWKTLEGEKYTNKLTPDDYILVDNSILSSNNNNNNNSNLGYKEGLLIGAYLGDGCSSSSNNCNSTRTYLSLNAKKIEKLSEILVDWNIGKPVHNCINVSTSNKEVNSLIKRFVMGNYAIEKSLNLACLLESTEFRQGIIDGFYITDGGNKNRVYSISKQLIDDIEVVMVSLGKTTARNEDNRIGQIRQFRDEPTFITQNIVYCVRHYSNKKSCYTGVFITDDKQNMYIKVKDITELTLKDNYVYCLSVKGDAEPYFTLPSGFITHNCRFHNNLDLMKDMAAQANSFGASPATIGSHRVVTINFNSLALQAKDPEDYLKYVYDRCLAATKILRAHKNLILYLSEKGVQPLIKEGWINMNRMFSTIGIIGLPEAQETLRMKFQTNKDFIKETLNLLNETVVNLSSFYNLAINLEQIPGENARFSLCQKDKLKYGEDKVPYPFYSNQFSPLTDTVELFEKIEIEGKYYNDLTGGGIAHLRCADKLTSKQFLAILQIALEEGCGHIAFSSVHSICANNHSILGKHEICPICNGKIIDYLERIVGYHQRVSAWGVKARDQDFENRKFLKVALEV